MTTYDIIVSGSDSGDSWIYDETTQQVQALTVTNSRSNRIQNAAFTFTDANNVCSNWSLGDSVTIKINETTQFEGYLDKYAIQWDGVRNYKWWCVGKTTDVYRYFTSSNTDMGSGRLSGNTDYIASSLVHDYVPGYTFRFRPSSNDTSTNIYMNKFDLNGRSVGKCLEDLTDIDGFSFMASGSKVIYYQPSGHNYYFNHSDVLSLNEFSESTDNKVTSVRIVGGIGNTQTTVHNYAGDIYDTVDLDGYRSFWQWFRAEDDYLNSIELYINRCGADADGFWVGIYPANSVITYQKDVKYSCVPSTISGGLVTSSNCVLGRWGHASLGDWYDDWIYLSGTSTHPVELTIEISFPRSIISKIYSIHNDVSTTDGCFFKEQLKLKTSYGNKIFDSFEKTTNSDEDSVARILEANPYTEADAIIYVASSNKTCRVSLGEIMALTSYFISGVALYPSLDTAIENGRQYFSVPSGTVKNNWTGNLTFSNPVPLAKGQYYFLGLSPSGQWDTPVYRFGGSNDAFFSDKRKHTYEMANPGGFNIYVPLGKTPSSFRVSGVACKLHFGGLVTYNATGAISKEKDRYPYLLRNENITDISSAKYIGDKILDKFSDTKIVGSVCVIGNTNINLLSGVSGSLSSLGIENTEFDVVAYKHIIDKKTGTFVTELSLNEEFYDVATETSRILQNAKNQKYE